MSQSNKAKSGTKKFELAFERGIMRSMFVSLFWAVILHRKESGKFTLQALAKSIGANKAEVSRWFRGDPNWTVNTIASIANALDVDLKIEAIDRKSGQIFTAAGIENPPVENATAALDDGAFPVVFKGFGNSAGTSTDRYEPPQQVAA